MKILLAISGASGVIYGKRLLEVLSKKEDIEVELVISEAGLELVQTELHLYPEEITDQADKVYQPGDLKAPPSSGSSKYEGMAIVPCSMSSLSKIANGISDDLITRAAAVFIKQDRKVVLTPRETPLTTTWLENMKELSEEGVTILPAMPAFYNYPDTMNDLVDFVVGKIMDSLEIDNSLYQRWR